MIESKKKKVYERIASPKGIFEKEPSFPIVTRLHTGCTGRESPEPKMKEGILLEIKKVKKEENNKPTKNTRPLIS